MICIYKGERPDWPSPQYGEEVTVIDICNFPTIGKGYVLEEYRMDPIDGTEVGYAVEYFRDPNQHTTTIKLAEQMDKYIGEEINISDPVLS